MDNFNAFYKKHKTVFPTQTRAGMLNLLYHQKLYEAKQQFSFKPGKQSARRINAWHFFCGKQRFVFVNIIFINYNKTAAEKSTAVEQNTNLYTKTTAVERSTAVKLN